MVAGKKQYLEIYTLFLCANHHNRKQNLLLRRPFSIPLKITEYLGINLTKDSKDLHAGNKKLIVRRSQKA